MNISKIQKFLSILKWVKERQKVKTVSKLINLNQCSDWYLDKNNNLYHKSQQFFKVKGVVTKVRQVGK